MPAIAVGTARMAAQEASFLATAVSWLWPTNRLASKAKARTSRRLSIFSCTVRMWSVTPRNMRNIGGRICGRSGAGQPPADLDQRPGGVAQAQEVAAQHIEPLDVRGRHRPDKHPVLDGLDLGLDRLQHRHVIVDDEVEDGVEDEILALGERRRADSQCWRTAE